MGYTASYNADVPFQIPTAPFPIQLLGNALGKEEDDLSDWATDTHLDRVLGSCFPASLLQLLRASAE